MKSNYVYGISEVSVTKKCMGLEERHLLACRINHVLDLRSLKLKIFYYHNTAITPCVRLPCLFHAAEAWSVFSLTLTICVACVQLC